MHETKAGGGPKFIKWPEQHSSEAYRPLMLGNSLALGRCPHCRVDYPNLEAVFSLTAHVPDSGEVRYWRVYKCSRCCGLVCGEAKMEAGEVVSHFPQDSTAVDSTIPAPACEYLRQALDSMNAPAGAVMLSNSAVDAMLKIKGYTKGRLFDRIDKAKDDHLITPEMARWAHDVRLDANDPRHADEEYPLPTLGDARRVVDFTQALAQLLFVLPARVHRGLEVENEEK